MRSPLAFVALALAGSVVADDLVCPGTGRPRLTDVLTRWSSSSTSGLSAASSSSTSVSLSTTGSQSSDSTVSTTSLTVSASDSSSSNSQSTGFSSSTSDSTGSSSSVTSTESTSVSASLSTSLSTTLSTSESTSSASSGSSASSTSSVTGSSTTATRTSSSTVSSPTVTRAPRVVRNEVTNGNFARYDPAAPGGIFGFLSGGNARLIQGYGYTGDGSQEANCVGMIADKRTTNPGPEKRQSQWDAMVEQQLLNMEAESDYTVRFFYSIVRNDVADTCRINGYYGDDLFASTPDFPVVSESVLGNTPWLSIVLAAAVRTSSGFIRFSLTCDAGGYADVFIDQVFVSNQVSPDDMDNISLFYGSVFTATSTTSSSTTSSEITTTSSTTTSTTSTSTTPSSTTTSTTSSTTSTSSSAAASSTTSPGTEVPKTCASLGSSPISGRACGRRIYSGSSGFYQSSGSDITQEQCAALCLADPRCQSFQWSVWTTCSNTCSLLETVATTTSGSPGPGPYHWDRSCIADQDCAAQPDGTKCVNAAMGITVGSGGCQQGWGTPKSCAVPILTTTVNPVCGSSDQCRDICAKYPSCKSYSIAWGGGVTCRLYNSVSQDVSVSGASGVGQFFTDMSCHECKAGVGFFKYIPLVADLPLPSMMCPPATGLSTTLTSSASTTSALTSSSPSSLGSVTPGPLTTTTPSSTISSSSSTTVGGCPNGMPAPGACYDATPTAEGSQCWKRGVLPAVEVWTLPRDEYPNQFRESDCAFLCKQDSRCKAYGFDWMTGCHFSPVTLDQGGFFADATSNAMWYDMGCKICYICPESNTPVNTYPETGTDTPTPTPTPVNTYPETTPIDTYTTPSSNYTYTSPSSNHTYTTPSSNHTYTTPPLNHTTTYYSNQTYPQATTTTSTTTTTPRPLPTCGLGGRGCAKLTFPPRDRYCNRQGWNEAWTYGLPLSEWPDQANAEQCAATCAKKGCSAFAFNPSTDSCRFMDHFLTGWNFIDSAGAPTIWHDLTCFDCYTCEDTSLPPSSTFAGNSTVPTVTPPINGTYTSPTLTTTPATTTTTPTPVTTTTPFSVPTGCVSVAVDLNDNVNCGMPATSSPDTSEFLISPYLPQSVTSLADCGRLCLRQPDCYGFSYEASSRTCYHYNNPVHGLQVTYSTTSGTRYYDRGCFTCTEASIAARRR